MVFYNDHGLNFFLDKMPTFAVGAAPEYPNADEGWGLPTLPPARGNEDLSWHLIEHLVAAEFDVVTCQEMLVDHAFTLPLRLFWPDDDVPPVTVVPIASTPCSSRCRRRTAPSSSGRRSARPSPRGSPTSVSSSSARAG